MQYVEPLSDARTNLGERRVLARQGWAGEKGGFFSVLLGATVEGERLNRRVVPRPVDLDGKCSVWG